MGNQPGVAQDFVFEVDTQGLAVGLSFILLFAWLTCKLRQHLAPSAEEFRLLMSAAFITGAIAWVRTALQAGISAVCFLLSWGWNHAARQSTL